MNYSYNKLFARYKSETKSPVERVTEKDLAATKLNASVEGASNTSNFLSVLTIEEFEAMYDPDDQ